MDTSFRQQSEPVSIKWSKTDENWDLGQKWGNQLQWSLTLFLRWRGYFLNSILFSDQCCWEAMLPDVFEEFWSLDRNKMTQINQIYYVLYPITENKTELTKSTEFCSLRHWVKPDALLWTGHQTVLSDSAWPTLKASVGIKRSNRFILRQNLTK